MNYMLTPIQADSQGRPQEDSRVSLQGYAVPIVRYAQRQGRLTHGHHTEGVLVAKKDFNLPKHGDIDTKNLYVAIPPSRTSETPNGQLMLLYFRLLRLANLSPPFSWQYYYYTLTPEGLDYLREWLHLPAEIVPQTHIKQQRSHAPPRGMMGEDRERRPGGRGGPRGDRGDREGGYRRREFGAEKEGGAPGEFTPQFRGGFGRSPQHIVCFLGS
ncbi:hypothetical protein LTR66_006394 [Elasticomyces elasticus]|nr:hypothetical protein LTR66_006394 [Elasticomyces elasticus]